MKLVPSINLPELRITANNVWPIPGDAMESFEFIADERTALPRCVIRFTDLGSKRLASLAGLGIGTPITFYIDEADVKNKNYDAGRNVPNMTSMLLTPLSVAKVHSSGDGKGGEHFEMLLEHPWKMFKDFSSHAYAGKANSEIIKDLLSSAKGRGFEFEAIDDSQFIDSDEDGCIPRYKCGEGDLDFITNHLIPYTTINKNPATFWIDEVNCIHLNTFKNMYQSEPKVIVFFGDEADIDDAIRSKASSMNGVAIAKSRIVKIGTDNPEDIISVIKPEVSIDDVSHMITYTGHLLPKISIGNSNKGMSDNSHIPIMLNAMTNSDASDKKIYRNHPVSDLKAVALHEQELFNSFFTIEVKTTFCGHLVHTGDNIELYVKPDPSKTPMTNNWMNGKWHLRAIKYTFENGSLQNTLVLIRPSFNINKANTSLMNIDDYYSVGMVTV